MRNGSTHLLSLVSRGLFPVVITHSLHFTAIDKLEQTNAIISKVLSFFFLFYWSWSQPVTDCVPWRWSSIAAFSLNSELTLATWGQRLRSLLQHDLGHSQTVVSAVCNPSTVYYLVFFFPWVWLIIGRRWLDCSVFITCFSSILFFFLRRAAVRCPLDFMWGFSRQRLEVPSKSASWGFILLSFWQCTAVFSWTLSRDINHISHQKEHLLRGLKVPRRLSISSGTALHKSPWKKTETSNTVLVPLYKKQDKQKN